MIDEGVPNNDISSNESIDNQSSNVEKEQNESVLENNINISSDNINENDKMEIIEDNKEIKNKEVINQEIINKSEDYSSSPSNSFHNYLQMDIPDRTDLIERTLEEINTKLMNDTTSFEEIVDITSRIFRLINYKEVYENPVIWWEKQINKIYDLLMKKYIKDYNDIQKVIDLIRNISKKFKNVCGTTLVDSCFDILKMLKENKEENKDISGFKSIANRQTLAECLHQDTLTKYSSEYMQILREIGDESCKSENFDEGCHQYVASWFIYQNIISKSSDTNKEQVECLIYQPLFGLISKSIFGYNVIKKNNRGKGLDLLFFSQNLERTLKKTEKNSILRRITVNRVFWNAIFLHDLNFKNYSTYLLQIINQESHLLTNNLKRTMEKMLETSPVTNKAVPELPKSISFYRNYLHSIRVVMYFLSNKFSVPLLLPNKSTEEIYGLNSIEKEDTSGIVLDILEILCELGIAKDWIGEKYLQQINFSKKKNRNVINKKDYFDIKNYKDVINISINKIMSESPSPLISETHEEQKLSDFLVTSNMSSYIRTPQPNSSQKAFSLNLENYKNEEELNKVNKAKPTKTKQEVNKEEKAHESDDEEEEVEKKELIEKDFESLGGFLNSLVLNLDPTEHNFRLSQIIPSKLIVLLLERMLNECISVLGVPPCSWCLASIGSLSRLEVCPFSDLECVMLIEEKNETIEQYFKDLCMMLEHRVISLEESEYPLFAFGSVIKKGFSFDSAYKPLPYYLLTPREFAKRQMGNTNWDNMNDITATRVPGYMTGNKVLLFEYFTRVNDAMSNEEYRKQYVDGYMNDFVKFFNVYCEFSSQFQRENTLTHKSTNKRLDIDSSTPIMERKVSQLQSFDVKSNFCRIPTWMFDIFSIKYSLSFGNNVVDRELTTIKYLEGLKNVGIFSGSLVDKFAEYIEFAYQLRIETHFLKLKEEDDIHFDEMSKTGVERVKYFFKTIVNPTKEAFNSMVHYDKIRAEQLEKRKLSEKDKHLHNSTPNISTPTSPLMYNIHSENSFGSFSGMGSIISNSINDMSSIVNEFNQPKIFNYNFQMELYFMIEEEEFYYRLAKVCNEIKYEDAFKSEISKYTTPTFIFEKTAWELKKEYIKLLLGDTGLSRKTHSGTNHNVNHISGLYFKQSPEAPGIESAVSTLYKIIVQHGVPLSKTSSLRYAPFKKEMPVQISLEIEGETLHEYLDPKLAKPRPLSNLDEVDLSDMLVMGMVVPRGDGKPSNWIVNVNRDGLKRMVSVDNDQDLIVDSVASSKLLGFIETSFITKSKNILFCFPFLNGKVHKSTQKRFSTIKVKEVIRTWVEKISEIDTGNTDLFNEKICGEFFEKYKKQDMNGGCVIPMLFHPKTIIFLYERIKSIKKLLRRHSDITHMNLFRGIDYFLSTLHRVQLEQKKTSPLERFLQVEQNQYDKIIGSDRLKTTVKTHVTLESRLKSIPKDLLQVPQMRVPFLIIQVEKLFEKKLKLQKVKRELLSMKSTSLKQETEPLLKEEIFSSIKFDSYDENVQYFILKEMNLSKVAFTRLKFNKLIKENCINDLKSIFKQSPKLMKLNLENTSFLTEDILNYLFKYCKQIYKLRLNKLPMRLFDKTNLLQNLYQLEIRGCDNLQHVSVPPSVSLCKISANDNLLTISFSQKGNETSISIEKNKKLATVTGLNFRRHVPLVKIVECDNFTFLDNDKNQLKEILFWFNSNERYWISFEKELNQYLENKKPLPNFIGMNKTPLLKLHKFLGDRKKCIRCKQIFFDLTNISNNPTCYFHKKKWDEKNGRHNYGYYPCCHSRDKNAIGCSWDYHKAKSKDDKKK